MPAPTVRKIRTAGVIVAATMFVLSLGFSTLLYGEDSSFSVGLACLLFGMSYVAWYANPFLFFTGCLLLENKPRWALVSSMVATALMLTAFTITQIEKNEAGHLAPVIGYGLGFYLWLSCNLVLLLTCVAAITTTERAISATVVDP